MPTCSHKHARVKKTLFTQEKCCGALRGIIIMYPRAAWEECRQWTAVVRAAPLAGRLAFQLRALARGHGSSIYSYVGYALGKRSAKYSKPGVVFCFLLFPPHPFMGYFQCQVSGKPLFSSLAALHVFPVVQLSYSRQCGSCGGLWACSSCPLIYNGMCIIDKSRLVL